MADKFIFANQIPERKTPWFWKNLILDEGVTFLTGLPGSNKSTLAARIAAQASKQLTMDGQLFKAKDDKNPFVIWYGLEDPEGETRNRLQALGADGRRILILTEGALVDFNAPPKERFVAFERRLQQQRPKLVVIDTLAKNVLPYNVTHAGHVGLMLDHQLQPLARKYKCVILVLHHSNHSNGNLKIRDLFSGSQALERSTRQALFMAKVDKSTRLLVVAKSSWSAHGAIAVTVKYHPEETGGGLAEFSLDKQKYAHLETIHDALRWLNAYEKLQDKLTQADLRAELGLDDPE